MPITGAKTGSDKGASSAAAGRTTFRPPWVKEAPKTVAAPANDKPSWAKRNAAAPSAPANGTQKEVKLQSREIKVPVMTQRKTSIPDPAPVLKPKPKEIKVIAPEDNYETSSSEYEEVTDSEEEEEVTEEESEEEEEEEAPAKLPIQVKLKPVEKPKPKVEKSPSSDKAGKFVRPVLKKVPKIDEMPKKVVQQPSIPERKVLRPVEKPTGFKEPAEQKDFVRPPLKKVESITKKAPSSSIPPPPPPPMMVPPPPPPPGLLAPTEEIPPELSGDEMDDIDKLRDDLQSTKQMLALELRNKEAQERENKRLLAKIQQLEAELNKSNESGSNDKPNKSDVNSDALVKSLKSEADEAQKTSKLLEKKYQESAEQLDQVKSEVEEQKRTIANLDKKLAQGQVNDFNGFDVINESGG